MPSVRFLWQRESAVQIDPKLQKLSAASDRGGKPKEVVTIKHLLKSKLNPLTPSARSAIPSVRKMVATPVFFVQKVEDGELLHFELPGVRKEDIKIFVKGHSVSVHAVQHIVNKGAAPYEQVNAAGPNTAHGVSLTIDVNAAGQNKWPQEEIGEEIREHRDSQEVRQDVHGVAEKNDVDEISASEPCLENLAGDPDADILPSDKVGQKSVGIKLSNDLHYNEFSCGLKALLAKMGCFFEAGKAVPKDVAEGAADIVQNRAATEGNSGSKADSSSKVKNVKFNLQSTLEKWKKQSGVRPKMGIEEPFEKLFLGNYHLPKGAETDKITVRSFENGLLSLRIPYPIDRKS